MARWYLFARRGPATPSENMSATGARPDWEQILGAELFTMVQSACIRDGLGWPVAQMVAQAIVDCTEDEALALAVSCGPCPKGLRKLVTNWIGGIPDEPLTRTFQPLPPLRSEPEFPHYTTDQVAALPCGADLVRMDLREWWQKWDRCDVALQLGLDSGIYYESLRHHPYFQREAAAMRNFMESQRELSALLIPIDDEEVAERGLTPSWLPEGKGKVAA